MASNARSLGWLYSSLFLLMSALSAWLMRIKPALNDVPIHFQGCVDAARLDDGILLKTKYTGIASLDLVLSFLVAAFVPGCLGTNKEFTALQVYFLINFTGIILLFEIEAYRERNSSSVIRWPMAWAFFYQTLGGAPAIAMYYFFCTRCSTDDGYLDSGRAVSHKHSMAILPSVVVVYLVPTLAMYVPWDDYSLTQNLVAYWQVAPLLVDVVICLLSSHLPVRPTPPGSCGDVKHLKHTYIAGFFITACVHLGTMYYVCFSSGPELSFSSVFLPNQDNWKLSTTLGLHWIFQWDAWFIFGSALLHSWVSVLYIQQKTVESSIVASVKALAILCLLAVIFGPSAAVLIVWEWREAKMVLIEDHGGSKLRVK